MKTLVKNTLVLLLMIGFMPSYGQESEKDKYVTQQQKLNSASSKIWVTRQIPVCWENPSSSNSQERRWVRDAVRGSWEQESRVRFTGWGTCESGSKGIRILIEDRKSQGPHTKGLGTNLDGKKNGMGLNFTFKNWNTNFDCTDELQFCIEAIAVHEFGHALSFAHEQNRDDTPGQLCQDQAQGTNGDWNVTPYDAESVMNYCSSSWTNNGDLTARDIIGVRYLYGAPRSEVTSFGYSFAVGDFNKDGKDDLAVGAPRNEGQQGRVYLYKGGSGKKLKYWHTIDQTFLGRNERGDHFGWSLASGDFNNDGFDDLAVGIPREKPGNDPRSGFVMIFKGTHTKLEAWHGLSQKKTGKNEEGDRFGHALAAGDFNGDGKDDLAVGVPGEAPGGDPKSGDVVTFRGTSSGLASWKGFGGQKGLGKNEAGDQFGSSLAAGDFNGDGKDDLAVGSPGEAPGSSPRSGDVLIYKGASNGLSPWKGFGGQKGLGSNEAGDRIGATLVAGDFNGDGKDDLAVGVPGEAPGRSPKSGDVLVYKGSSNGPMPWKGFGGQKGLDTNQSNDLVGWGLASGDYNGDGKDDIAVGVPGKNISGQARSGNVLLYKGGSTVVPWKNLKGQVGIGKNESGDQFGFNLISGDFNGDNKDDLAVALIGEKPGSIPFKTGAVFIYHGTSKSNILSPIHGINP